MKIINLMKHDCTLKVGDQIRVYPPHGKIAQAQEILEEIGSAKLDSFLSVPVVSREFGEVENLPEPEEGTIYIVPSIVLSAVPHRKDVFAPDSGKSAERNEKGHIRSVCRLIGN